MSHPKASVHFRPKLMSRLPVNRFATALEIPKVATITKEDWTSGRLQFEVITGRRLRSKPTIDPTNALMRTKRVNSGQFSFKPSCLFFNFLNFNSKPGVNQGHYG